jgi:pSer/pThr/pTyr-binding forkhead associated (FHA) protein
LFDLGSGHGTRINKKLVDKHSYVPLAEGDQIKFGESTRLCIFHTEFSEEEEEAEETKTSSILIKRKRPMPVEEDEDQGVTWYSLRRLSTEGNGYEKILTAFPLNI